MAHGYFKVIKRPGDCLKTIHADLPGLHAQVREIQQALPSENDNVAGVPNCSVAGDSMEADIVAAIQISDATTEDTGLARPRRRRRKLLLEGLHGPS
ncbi:MAG: hypothetical protein IPI44_22110 [Sulfuritalea sp.]|nr:hypothetical protein [Sulfuritalea sp.]